MERLARLSERDMTQSLVPPEVALTDEQTRLIQLGVRKIVLKRLLQETEEEIAALRGPEPSSDNSL